MNECILALSLIATAIPAKIANIEYKNNSDFSKKFILLTETDRIFDKFFNYLSNQNNPWIWGFSKIFYYLKADRIFQKFFNYL